MESTGKLADFADGIARLRVRGLPVYIALLAAWTIVAAIVAVLRDAMPDTPVFLLFVPLIVAAAFIGGLGPGLVATFLGLVTGSALAREGSPVGVATPYMFSAIGLVASVVGEWSLRARERGERAMQALAEREAHLRSIYDTAPDALVVIDERGIVQTFSSGAEKMFGWTAAEALGCNVSLLMPEPHRSEHDGYIRRYLDTGEKHIVGIGRIVIGARKSGTTFPMELAVGEVTSAGGRLFTGFMRDLTERQATEARLQELQSELVHISRLSALGEMASALAHELNQPLSAIANYLGGAKRLMERDRSGDQRAADAVDKAAAQALRAGDIIRRLRDFLARGEGERSVESLPKLVQDACALAMVGAKEAGVRVHYALDPRANRVVVDRVQIQQVIINLVRNALDAMDAAERRELVVRTELGEDGMAVVSVADTGPGLDETVAARLFQPFITTKEHGMGVGLSISRTIVEAHGGDIWAEPNHGGGAVFRFTLRLAVTPVEVD
jgi:two-component system sensor kinase FixL